MRWFLWPFGLLSVGALILRGATPYHHGHWASLGGAWWFVLGLAIGLVVGFLTHVAAVRPWHWRVRVKSSYGRAKVVIRRLWEEVEVAELSAAADDFDDDLHRVIAEARQKAAAMEVANR